MPQSSTAQSRPGKPSCLLINNAGYGISLHLSPLSAHGPIVRLVVLKHFDCFDKSAFEALYAEHRVS